MILQCIYSPLSEENQELGGQTIVDKRIIWIFVVKNVAKIWASLTASKG